MSRIKIKKKPAALSRYAIVVVQPILSTCSLISCTKWPQNSKHEIRNKFKATNPNDQNTHANTVLNFCHSDFGFVSDFEIRIWLRLCRFRLIEGPNLHSCGSVVFNSNIGESFHARLPGNLRHARLAAVSDCREAARRQFQLRNRQLALSRCRRRIRAVSPLSIR